MESGLVSIKCNRSVDETLARLLDILSSLNLEVFANIDHSGGAQKFGMSLRPTKLLIFGNPKGGTPLMQDKQTTGIDLPLKVLIWEDEAAQVWLTYNDVNWIAARHGLREGAMRTLPPLANVLEKIIGLLN